MSFPMMKFAYKSYCLGAISFASVQYAGDLGQRGGIGADRNVRLTAERPPFSRL